MPPQTNQSNNPQTNRPPAGNRAPGGRPQGRGDRGNRSNDFGRSESDLTERMIALDRVARVVKGGRRFRFRATVVVGDNKGQVGFGVGKGRDVASAIQKATATARKNMIKVQLKGTTINHEVNVKFGGAKVFMKPAPEGTGLIAGGAVRSVLEIAGVRDVFTKALGSSNKINNASATIQALKSLKSDPANAAEAVSAEADKTKSTKADDKPTAKTDKSVLDKTTAKSETTAQSEPKATTADKPKADSKPEPKTKAKPAAKSEPKS